MLNGNKISLGGGWYHSTYPTTHQWMVSVVPFRMGGVVPSITRYMFNEVVPLQPPSMMMGVVPPTFLHPAQY
jgi:hypothetical protein